jgi:hypothetical protein
MHIGSQIQDDMDSLEVGNKEIFDNSVLKNRPFSSENKFNLLRPRTIQGGGFELKSQTPNALTHVLSQKQQELFSDRLKDVSLPPIYMKSYVQGKLFS